MRYGASVTMRVRVYAGRFSYRCTDMPSIDWSRAVIRSPDRSRAEDVHSTPGPQGLEGRGTGSRGHLPPRSKPRSRAKESYKAVLRSLAPGSGSPSERL